MFEGAKSEEATNQLQSPLNRPLVLAELGQSHEGSFALAKSFVELARDSGADGVKVQIHDYETESTLDEPFRASPSGGDKSRYAYWKRTSLTPEEWAELRAYSQNIGLLFIPSIFSLDVLSFVQELNVDGWKIGSAEAILPWFVERICSLGEPVIISSGLSSWAEMESIAKRHKQEVPFFSMLHCTTKYPTPLDSVGLNNVVRIKEELGVVPGISDHSGTISPSLLAISRGAQIIENHVTFHKGMRGFDTDSSITFEELKMLTSLRDDFWKLDNNPTDKTSTSASLLEMRSIFGRSVAPRAMIPKGTVLRPEMFTFKKPAGGIEPARLHTLEGKTARTDLRPDRIVREEDIE